ncbi:MAG: hypothetical protein PVF73_10810 [Bacteroidales bacterium]|jgi:hypothetical protein
MNKLLLASAVSLLYSGIIFSQKSVNDCLTDPLDTLFPSVLCGIYRANTIFLESDHFIDDWKKGEVLLSSGEVVRDEYLRYNGLLDNVFWLRVTDYKIAMLYKELVKGFNVYSEHDEKGKKYRKMIVPGYFSEGEVFLEVLTEGKISVYCYRRIEMEHSTFEVYPDYQYYLKVNEDYRHIFLRRFSVISVLPDEEKIKMRSIIRSNRLRMKDEQDLIRAFELLNKADR